jgi:hypothetical protein
MAAITKTSTQPLREGFHTVTPYLVIDRLDEFLTFLQQAFGAEEQSGERMPDRTVMHASMRIGDSHREQDFARDFPAFAELAPNMTYVVIFAIYREARFCRPRPLPLPHEIRGMREASGHSRGSLTRRLPALGEFPVSGRFVTEPNPGTRRDRRS